MARAKDESRVTLAAHRWRKHQTKVRKQIEAKLPVSGWYDGAMLDHTILADAYLEVEVKVKEQEKNIKKLVIGLEKICKRVANAPNSCGFNNGGRELIMGIVEDAQDLIANGKETL